MADINDKLNQTEEELKRIQEEAQECEKALNSIPLSISTNIEIEGNIQEVLSELDAFKNINITPEFIALVIISLSLIIDCISM